MDAGIVRMGREKKISLQEFGVSGVDCLNGRRGAVGQPQWETIMVNGNDENGEQFKNDGEWKVQHG